jgi:hypothetical protein
MRIILQDTTSGWYYQGHETWTPNPSVAFDFQFSAGLPEFCEKLDLWDVQLLVQNEAAATNILPVAISAPQP